MTLAVGLVRAVREVQAEDVDARGDQLANRRLAARRRTDGRDDLRVPHRASLQYRLSRTVTTSRLVARTCHRRTRSGAGALPGASSRCSRRWRDATSALRSADWNDDATGGPARRAAESRMSAEPRTIAELARALRAREVTAEAVTNAASQQIAERNPSINAFITVLADQALAQARAGGPRAGRRPRSRTAARRARSRSRTSSTSRGTPTTAASRVRDRAMSRRDDAEVVKRLREAGAVFVGKTNLHEFALGTTNEDSAYRPGAPPARSEPLAGRLVGRLRGVGARGHGVRVDRHRHRRLDPHPVGGMRPRRAEAGDRRDSRPTASCR